MPATLTLRDETARGDVIRTRTLDFAAAEITVRELLVRRSDEEVRDFNRGDFSQHDLLVRPDAAQALRRAVDPERQRRVTLLAFQANRFFVLLGDRQLESLDDTVPLGADTAVAFVRVVPLVGA